MSDRWANITPAQVQQIFVRMEIDKMSLPYYSEMLDFNLAENTEAEIIECEEYHATFGVIV